MPPRASAGSGRKQSLKTTTLSTLPSRVVFPTSVDQMKVQASNQYAAAVSRRFGTHASVDDKLASTSTLIHDAAPYFMAYGLTHSDVLPLSESSRLPPRVDGATWAKFLFGPVIEHSHAEILETFRRLFDDDDPPPSPFTQTAAKIAIANSQSLSFVDTADTKTVEKFFTSADMPRESVLAYLRGRKAFAWRENAQSPTFDVEEQFAKALPGTVNFGIVMRTLIALASQVPDVIVPRA